MKRYLGFLLFGVFLAPFTLAVSVAWLGMYTDIHLPYDWRVIPFSWRLITTLEAGNRHYSVIIKFMDIAIYFVPANIFILPVASIFLPARSLTIFLFVIIGSIEGYIGVFYLRVLFSQTLHPLRLSEDMCAAAFGSAFSGCMFGAAVMLLHFRASKAS